MIHNCWGLSIRQKFSSQGRKFLSYTVSGIPELYPSRERARADARTLEPALKPRPIKIKVVAFDV